MTNMKKNNSVLASLSALLYKLHLVYMNLSDSYKLVKNGIQSISNIELINNQTNITSSNNVQYQVNIYYQELSRKNIIKNLPCRTTTQTTDDCCPICLTELNNTKLKHGRRCSHLFHNKCLNKWLQDETRQFNCPICRTPL